MTKKQRKFKQKQQRGNAKASPDRRDQIQIKLNGSPPQQRIPLWTLTGELFQPVRIHYDVSKVQKILKVFNKLRCLECDPHIKSWKWLYTGEANKLIFAKRLGKPAKPIVLGDIVFQADGHFYIEVHSIERALEAIPFFDRYLPRRAAQITSVSVVNRLFDVREAHAFTFERDDHPHFAAEDPIQTMLHALDAFQAQNGNGPSRTALIEAYLKKNASTPLPEVENIRIHYYREGIQQPWFVLGSRQYIAIQHWKGNSAYSQADYLREVVRSIGALPQ